MLVAMFQEAGAQGEAVVPRRVGGMLGRLASGRGVRRFAFFRGDILLVRRQCEGQNDVVPFRALHTPR